MKTREQKIADIDAAMKRWLTRVVRATNAIKRLQDQRKRLLRVTPIKPKVEFQMNGDPPKVAETVVMLDDASIPPVRPRGHARLAHLAEDMGAALRESAEDQGIPAFLDRSNPLIAEEMTRVRKAGEEAARKAMPLSGREAMKAVRRKK
jgi:hypothetical protein